jgi:hypothetical protein
MLWMLLFWERCEYTWSVMGHCWGLLKEDKKLIVFPFLSLLGCLAVLATFWVPFGDQMLEKHAQGWATYAVLFAYYVCNYFVVVFFNSALVGCAALRMAGHEDVSLATGFKLAAERIHLILGWSVVSASVGLALKAAENAHEKGSDIIAALLGTAWTMLTFLVVPALVIDGLGPFAAIQASSRLFKKTFGDQLISSWSFGAIFSILGAPGIALLGFGIYKFQTGSASLGLTLGGIGLVYLLLLISVQAALQAIFQTTLYLYLRDDKAPAGFDERLLRGAAKAA